MAISEPHNRFKASPFILRDGGGCRKRRAGVVSLCASSSSITSSLIEGEIVQKKEKPDVVMQEWMTDDMA